MDDAERTTFTSRNRDLSSYLFSLAKASLGAKRIGATSLLSTLVSLATILFYPQFAQAAGGNRNETLALTTYYSNYSNLSLSNAVALQLSPSLDLEMALRVQTIFAFTFVYNKFMDPKPTETTRLQVTMKGMGLGMKIDIPGFFFLGASKQDSSREAKHYPVNTFLYGEMLKLDTADIATQTPASVITPKYGFGMDVFLFNPTAYLSMRWGVINYVGDTHISYAAGLGVAF